MKPIQIILNKMIILSFFLPNGSAYAGSCYGSGCNGKDPHDQLCDTHDVNTIGTVFYEGP